MRKLEDIRKVAVLGSGMMGTGCAMVFAGAGYDVVLYDVVPEALPKVVPNMRKDLTFLAERGLGRLEDVEPTLDRVSTTLVMEDAVADADFVLEAVIEDMTLKQQIFHDLDQMCGPEAVLATNTSVMSPTEIASKAERRERIVGTHWWNPPFLIPLVEVVQTEETAPWVIELTMDLHRAIGKHPVHVKKDVPGFIANRLQHALWREADLHRGERHRRRGHRGREPQVRPRPASARPRAAGERRPGGPGPDRWRSTTTSSRIWRTGTTPRLS